MTKRAAEYHYSVAGNYPRHNQSQIIAWAKYTEDGEVKYRPLTTWAEVEQSPGCRIRKQFLAKQPPDPDYYNDETE